jgi:hypothetical protein
MASQSLKDTCKWCNTNNTFKYQLQVLKGYLRLPDGEILGSTGHPSKSHLTDAYAIYFSKRLYIVSTSTFAQPSDTDIDLVKQWIVDRLSPKGKEQ